MKRESGKSGLKYKQGGFNFHEIKSRICGYRICGTGSMKTK